MMKVFRATLLVSALLAGATSASAQTAAVAALRTAPEQTNFRETTRYDAVVAFVKAVADASPVIHLDTMGYTFEGRAIPLAIVGRLPNKSAEAIRASGKTVVYLQGNIHAGEVEGKESLMIFLREVAQGRHAQLLDSLVLLVAPIYNADGNERVRINNRGAQHGPIAGMGQRPNAQELDLNRDHMKLDSPEARSFTQMLNRYDPHVGVDLHTTNGSRHGYYLTYSPPLHPNTAEPIIALLRNQWLPELTRNIKQKYGWDYYYYGNFQGQGENRGWYTFEHVPRFNNNYVGLRNRIAILSEAYSYATFEDRIKATSRFVEEVLSYARAHATPIRRLVADLDRTSIVGQRFALNGVHQRAPEKVSILVGTVTEERNPYSGATILRRADAVTPELMWEWGTFVGTEFEVVPSRYIITEPTPQVLATLESHGVRFTRTTEATQVNAQTFKVDSSATSQRAFQNHNERTVFGSWQAPAQVNVPAQSVVIEMNQPLARMLFTLMEPRSDDGLVHWNYFDRALTAGRGVPILRVQ